MMSSEERGEMVSTGESVAVPKNLQINELNELSSMLAETIYEMARTLKKNRKTGTIEKSQILTRLMKSYSDLVKTHRALNGLDQQVGSISAGVIIIPGKADDWIAAAHTELDNAKNLIEAAVIPQPEESC